MELAQEQALVKALVQQVCSLVSVRAYCLMIRHRKRLVLKLEKAD